MAEDADEWPAINVYLAGQILEFTAEAAAANRLRSNAQRKFWRLRGGGLMRLINALFIALPASALLMVPAVAQTYGNHPYMGSWGWGMMILGPIMMIVFIAVAVVVVVLVVRWLGGTAGYGGALHSLPGKTPLDILKERFAKGEIDKEEFDERRRVLGE